MSDLGAIAANVRAHPWIGGDERPPIDDWPPPVDLAPPPARKPPQALPRQARPGAGRRLAAAELVKQLDGRWHGDCGIARCPAHEDRTPSLSISDGEGALLVHCHAGCEQFAVIEALRGLGLWPDRRAPEDPPPSEADRNRERQPDQAREEKARRRAAFINELWRRTWVEALPPQSPPIAAWFQARGIPPERLDLDHLPVRWAPDCPLCKGTAPAMVALMTNSITCKSVGLHRTFLVPDGRAKAPLDAARMMLGKAGIVRLSPDDEVELGLGICEGLETGLAIMATGWRPIWACGSLGALTAFPVLDGIEALTVFSDPKAHELAGARKCARRWAAAGREARVRIPAAAGDWNSVLGEGL